MVRAAPWLAWPVGLALALGHLLGGLLPGVAFVVVDAAYVLAVVVTLHRGRWTRDRAALALLGAGVGIFALASLTGVPTARQPTAMLLNAAVLFAAAVALAVGAVGLAHRMPGLPARLGVTAVVVGSAGYLLNLLARWAVVLSGAAPWQAAVEDRAWVANVYLRGLDGVPDTMSLLLVWLDLMQVAYVVLTYVGFAGLAVAAGRAGAVSGSAARAVAAVGGVAAGLTVLCAVLAPVSVVAAEAAFVLTIPFMSTLVPALLACALLTHTPTAAPSLARDPARTNIILGK
ncbi:hypothetical protein GCM10009557_73000 [Virgisporangium ochraceum]